MTMLATAKTLLILAKRISFRFCCVAILLILTKFQYAQQHHIPFQKLDSIPATGRSSFIHDLQLGFMDSSEFLSVYFPLLNFAKKEKDQLMEWDMRYQYFLQRSKLQSTPQENIRLLNELKEDAEEKGFNIRLIVAQHYLFFEKYYFDQLSHKVLYTKILGEIELMQQSGFEKFSDFNPDKILYHDAKFLFELGDFDKALQIFHIAERFIQPSESKGQIYILILNHLQSIYQKRQEIAKALYYANMILQFVERPPTNDPKRLIFYQQWKGLVLLDIAAMLVKQGKLAESEVYALKGYKLAKVQDPTNRIALRLEYDALQVLVSTKLEMDQIEEVGLLIRRLGEIYGIIGGDYENYFNNIEYFECLASFHEIKGNFSESVHYNKLAKSLKDSLARRNDARHLEQLKQQLEIEKYTKKISLMERERELQKWLRNVTFAVLIFALLLVYFYFRKLHRQHRQRIVDLESAKNDLAKLTRRFRKKSAMAENLKLEMENLAHLGQRSEYLETLTNSTILTKDDWLRFRQVFEKAYPGFIEEKKFLTPELTPAELRYIVLDKLNLSTKEMANMLGVSPNAVRKTRARLHKKIKI